MAGATFGRKGMAGVAAAAPRAAFGANPRAAVPETDPSDPFAAQREAFIAAERARRGESGSDQAVSAAAAAPSRQTMAAARKLLPKRVDDFGGKSFPAAFLLWLLLGVGGAHRFYLDRPITGALQAALFLVSATLAALQYYAAFAGVMVCLMWMTADAALISRVAKAKRAAAAAD